MARHTWLRRVRGPVTLLAAAGGVAAALTFGVPALANALFPPPSIPPHAGPILNPGTSVSCIAGGAVYIQDPAGFTMTFPPSQQPVRLVYTDPSDNILSATVRCPGFTGPPILP